MARRSLTDDERRLLEAHRRMDPVTHAALAALAEFVAVFWKLPIETRARYRDCMSELFAEPEDGGARRADVIDLVAYRLARSEP